MTIEKPFSLRELVRKLKSFRDSGDITILLASLTWDEEKQASLITNRGISSTTVKFEVSLLSCYLLVYENNSSLCKSKIVFSSDAADQFSVSTAMKDNSEWGGSRSGLSWKWTINANNQIDLTKLIKVLEAGITAEINTLPEFKDLQNNCQGLNQKVISVKGKLGEWARMIERRHG
ncbi:hypothetical protein [endosymbiont GvMRE of Glomus versiforme]|uniref:hypothetical protein n=1 Tax=endosymbiont GvMRE of Glomus versiforme TaxID=2039283 RepID=UPI000EEC2ABF|nr:hypothetical protein [endosymbiont GvMRE of Glomus versiforme]RHZ35900.1 hypothetical protein GvMRE_Ic4g123 [endosymbiont GvMRE of Glomus versiforme]RHZ36622.1 hypothetical protein GvMRE_I2g8 [endosymbiont GvMRE of Glomus versiforme]